MVGRPQHLRQTFSDTWQASSLLLAPQEFCSCESQIPALCSTCEIRNLPCHYGCIQAHAQLSIQLQYLRLEGMHRKFCRQESIFLNYFSICRPTPFVPVPTAVFLVQAGEHDWVLVDTGPATPAWQRSFRAALSKRLSTAQDKLKLVLSKQPPLWLPLLSLLPQAFCLSKTILLVGKDTCSSKLQT